MNTTATDIEVINILDQVQQLLTMQNDPSTPADYIQAMENALRDHPLETLAAAMRVMKDRHEDLKASASSVWEVYEKLSMRIVPPVMQDSGIRTMKIDGVGRLQLGEVFNAKIVADKQTGYEWLRANGLGDLITETVNASSLKASLKDWLKKGKASPPEDIIEINVLPQATVVRT
jgi:hypothetical protein